MSKCRKCGGSSSFSFQLERYKDKETGEFYDESEINDIENDFEFESVYLNVEVSGSATFTPGKYTGPWEESYPSEVETEIESVLGPNNEDWSNRLSSGETEAIEEKLVDNVLDNDCDYDERDYDD